MSLSERVAVITGATGGLGRVAARQLAGQGARLALFGSHPERLAALASELGLPDTHYLTHVLDLRDPASGRAAAEAVYQRFGRADILLHLVGGFAGGTPVAGLDPAVLADMVQQHLWTTFYVAQAFVPRMASAGWGRVIYITSPAASLRPAAQNAAYAAGKAAGEALLLTLAQEVKDSGVTVNLLVVRTIDTGHERDRNPRPQNRSWSTPEEIAQAILYLCSDEARGVNGVRLPLYGAA